jgi:hypothetical protein
MNCAMVNKGGIPFPVEQPWLLAARLCFVFMMVGCSFSKALFEFSDVVECQGIGNHHHLLEMRESAGSNEPKVKLKLSQLNLC